MSESIDIKITPVRKLYYSEEYNSGIYACETTETEKVELNRFGNFVIKGNTVELSLKSEYNAKLEKVFDKERGVYYHIKGIYQDIPNDREKQRAYLETLISKDRVRNIFEAYPNDNVIELIRDNKIDHKNIHNVGEKSIETIRNKVIENFEFQEAYDFLIKYGITSTMIVKLVKHFNSAGLLKKKIRQNPYSLTEVQGVGFKKADEIAIAVGFDPKSPHRISSAIEFLLEEAAGNGDTYVRVSELIDSAVNLLGLEYDDVAIEENKKVSIVGNRVSLTKLYKAEKYISDKVAKINSHSNVLNFNIEDFIQNQEKKHNITLTDQQKSFFKNIKNNNLTILSGYAGCGKSMLQKLLIELLHKLRIDYKLLAPTGKAARVLSNYTGAEVQTIHSGIGLGKDKEHEGDVFIDEEFVIVDEASMMDVGLCAKLLSKCINENLRVLFIGDPAQIPSVSAGNVLHDLISSGVVPVTEVNIVFRQSEGGILDIATKVRQGEKFIKNNQVGIFNFGSNCTAVCIPKEKMEKGYIYYFKQFLEKYSSEDITIVTPTKKSELGTVQINKNIQELVNPKSDSKNEIEYGFDKVIFREGDYVINTTNTKSIKDNKNKSRDIVNGDMGVITSIDAEEGLFTVDFGKFEIPFDKKDFKQFLHAWCLTKHKMQGSAAKVVIAIADKAHKFQLTANLLYTAFTRPEDYLVIISQGETINFALKKFSNLNRKTYLREMLKSSAEVQA